MIMASSCKSVMPSTRKRQEKRFAAVWTERPEAQPSKALQFLPLFPG